MDPVGAGWLRTFGGAEIPIIHRPGLHSADDLITWIPADRVAGMGDLLLSESMSALDDIAGYLAFLDGVLDAFPPDTRFMSGPGRDFTAEGVKSCRDALISMVGIIWNNVAACWTLEQMVNDDVLRDCEAQYGLLDPLGRDDGFHDSGFGVAALRGARHRILVRRAQLDKRLWLGVW